MEFFSLVLLTQKQWKSALIKAMWELCNIINRKRLKKSKESQQHRSYEEAQKVDQRDQGTETMAKRTTGEPKAKLEMGKEKWKADFGTECTILKHS